MLNISEKPLIYRLKKEWRAYLYLLPMLIVLLFLTIYPIAYTFYISLTDFGIGGFKSFYNYHYTGFSNYISLFSSKSQLALTIDLISNSFFWATASVAIFLLAGLTLAALLNQQIRGKWVYRTIILVPWAMPAFITILTWDNMLNFEYGVINGLLAIVHVAPVDWLQGSPVDVWSALLLTNTWLSFPFYTIVFLASMQSIPTELYESAEMDGASSFTRFTGITIPYIWPTIAFVGIMGWLFTFNNFYPIYLLTAGGPGYTTEIFVVEIYQEAFQYYTFAIAAAYSVINFLILLVIGILAIKYTKLTEGWLK